MECPGARPKVGPPNPASAARSRTGAAASLIVPLAIWPAAPCGRSEESPSSEQTPSPSPSSSGRGGPFCTTRLLSPSFRISSTACPGPRKKSVFAIGLYEHTRLGRQEIYAEFLETSEGVWFARFDPGQHVSVQAEYNPVYHVRYAIDAGTSRHTAAVFFQVQHNN